MKQSDLLLPVHILAYLAKQNSKTGSKQIAEALDIHQRTAQRQLARLTEAGYLQADSNSPKGYIFKGFNQ